MSVRRSVMEKVTFDTRLPLYGWLEDLDFSHYCSLHGRTVKCRQARMVHLGVSSGRVSGLRYGFSQVMNSYYLWKKGSCGGFDMLVYYWLRPFLLNLVLSPFSNLAIDRRGRLIGNFKAWRSILKGDIRPEKILEM